jgi:hypothetical protein
MNKAYSSVIIALVLLLLTAPAHALNLLMEDFTGVTILDGKTINLMNNPPAGPDDNLGAWIDFPNTQRWGISDNGQGGAGDYFAQHLVQIGDSTNLLFYGIDLSGLPELTSFTLDFDYVASNRSPQVVLAGMYDGMHSLDPFAPWFPPGDANDGIPFLNELLATKSDWDHAHFEGVVPEDFDVIAIGFIMGGTDGFRGVDNIQLDATTPVPEPATLLLFGSGLLGLAGLRRKYG